MTAAQKPKPKRATPKVKSKRATLIPLNAAPAVSGVTEVAAVWMPPADLKPWPKNPRKNDAAAVTRVCESIKRFGFGAPIVARASNREIIAGHTRWLAAKQLQLARVPVRLLDISEPEAHVLALADNRYTDLTGWSPDLHKMLGEFTAPDLVFAGWTPEELAKLGPHSVSFEASGELDLDKVVATLHKCPKCGHDF